MGKVWNIAKYLRLSKEDGDKDESDSILSQRMIIDDYIRNNFEDYNVVGEFIDDGFTGTNFKRPDFQRMINLVKDEKINCIIVKDLSRFGRDYIGVGEYLEKFFPVNDIRFVAINDGYDTISTTSNDEFIMPIKNIFNAHYSKDISRKVKTSFRALQAEGKFVGAFASYGYVKDPKNKHKLIIDEVAAIVVRRIFALYNSGVGKISIAKILNNEKIPCPSEYKKLNGFNYSNCNKMDSTYYWTYSTINNILKNEMYIGNMVQNKSIRKTVRGKAKKNDVENWIMAENTHEPIIDIDTWETTQTLLKKNTRQMGLNDNISPFAGYLFCGNCGRAMAKISRYNADKRIVSYVCGTYKRYGVDMCKRNYITYNTLEKIVLDKINEQIQKIGEINYTKTCEKPNNELEVKKYQLMLEKNLKLKKSLYEDYKDGILTKEEYLEYKEEYLREEDFIKSQLEVIQNHKKEENQRKNRWIENLLKYRNIKNIDREVVAETIDKIVITETDDELNVNVVFKFNFN